MKCFSYRQPWASLVMLQEKRVETRSQNFTVLAGRWHAVHASRTFTRVERALLSTEPFQARLADHGITEWNRTQATMPMGAILGVAFCGWIRPTIDVSITEQERAFGDYTKGRWAFGITQVFALADPILYVGRLGVWDLPAPVEREVLIGLQGIEALAPELSSDDLLNEAVNRARDARLKRQEVERLLAGKPAADTRTPIDRMIDQAVGRG